MGRHINVDAAVDELPDATRERIQLGLPADAQGHPLEPQAVISPDTHVGSDSEVPPGTPDAAASPANPDSLVERGLVGDGHELE